MRTRLTFVFLALSWSALAQFTVKGIIRDAEGERLPLAHVVVAPDSMVTVTNGNGEFVIKLSRGQKLFVVSYTGYERWQKAIVIQRDTTITVSLQPVASQLDEVVVQSQRFAQEDIIQSTRSSTNVLSQEEINAIPVLGGEADVIKVLQLLPGTVRGVEGSSDLFVRGGAADQNLVLLDGATIYNTSHLFGFLSVFNPDILQKVESVNGAFPAQMGGRLSSVLEVETTSDNFSETHLSGDIGLIASRLYVEQPIVKDKASIWVAGRRTYLDKVLELAGEELPYFFYDINAKLILTPTKRDRILISHYGGKDILELFRDRNNDGDGFLTVYDAGNSSQSLQWQRHSSQWNSNLNFTRTAYQYSIRNSFEDNRLTAFSDIEDYGIKWTLSTDSLKKVSLLTGAEWIHHHVSPSVVNSAGTISEFFETSEASGRRANEVSLFIQSTFDLSERWRLSGGIRLSGAITEDTYYTTPEPRIMLRYAVNKNETLKFSYSRMAQYMHRISNSAVTSPTDIWYPITEQITPQTSHQVSIAWQKFTESKIFLSVEGYYKAMDQMIGFEEGTNLFFNTDFESKLIQGEGAAWGAEFLVRKQRGKLTGWISYTLSWSRRQFDAINGGLWFPSRYDRRHNGAIVSQYAFNKRWALSVVWEFISGSRFTPVIGQYAITAPTGIGVDLLPVYAPINSVRLADTHRLDIGLKLKSKPEKKFQYTWFVGVYNAYNRANPVGITVEQDETNGALRYEQPGLIGLIPFISYGFKL